MPILFNTLLLANDFALKEVRLLRHKDRQSLKGRSPYELWRDDLGRPFAAIFTSEGSLRSALELMKRPIPAGSRIGTASGRELAARLLAANAPGLVVDPASAQRPRTFSRGMLDRLAATE